MTVETLLGQLRGCDIRLAPKGDRLIVDAPRGCLTPALRDTILQHKVELLGRLRAAVPWQDITPADLPPDWRIEWEERAAIREYEGGQAREHAEAEALREIIDRMRAAGECV